MNATQEQWRPIVGWEGIYELSDQGRVRSLARTVFRSGLPVRLNTKFLVVYVLDNGYRYVNIAGKAVALHRLLLTAFVRPPMPGEECRHLDGDRLNCSLSNLAWGTSSENNYDTVAHGRHHEARKTHCIHGHPFDQANTYVTPSRPRARYCRTCTRLRNAAGRSV